MRKIIRRFTPEAKTLIKKLSPTVKSALRKLTDDILENPSLGKELREELKGFYSARYSRYRVIYEYNEPDQIITIHFLGERKNVYQLFERLLNH